MSDRQPLFNDLSGNVEGPAVQAGSVGRLDMSRSTKTVNNIVREARSLNIGATLYRFLASLVGLAAVVGACEWSTPLDGMRIVCDALVVPSGWTEPSARWLTERSVPVGGMVQILLWVGLLALPRPRQLGWDLGQTMEWRSPSTVVLALALLLQSGHAWLALFTIGGWAVLGLWMVRRAEGWHGRSDHAAVVLMSLFLAMVFAPLLVCAWFFGRDRGHMPYAYVDSE